MGRIIPFRKTRRKPSGAKHWARAEAYGAPRGRIGWFPIALVALPLAAFTAVMLLPLEGGAPLAEGAAGFFKPDTRTAADLDAEQPQIAGWDAGHAGGTGRRAAGDRESARFGLCSGPVRTTCVVDGDTIWYQGTKIRIADLDTPEVSNPACANEAMMGRRATRRLQALLNAGPFSLEPNPEGRSEDRYGRSLMLVTRGGASLGAVLVDEGLAEQWGGPRMAWC
jgi:endonuclease YncB( thermonuclease family)